MGMPPMMLGAMKQMAKDIPDDALRDMCARVGVGMIRIYTGADVQLSLSMEELTSPNMDELIEQLITMRDNAVLTTPNAPQLAAVVEDDMQEFGRSKVGEPRELDEDGDTWDLVEITQEEETNG